MTAFYEIGCGLGRLRLAELDHTAASIEPAVAVAEAFLAGELGRLEFAQALVAWEGTASLLERIFT